EFRRVLFRSHWLRQLDKHHPCRALDHQSIPPTHRLEAPERQQRPSGERPSLRYRQRSGQYCDVRELPQRSIPGENAGFLPTHPLRPQRFHRQRALSPRHLQVPTPPLQLRQVSRKPSNQLSFIKVTGTSTLIHRRDPSAFVKIQQTTVSVVRTKVRFYALLAA